MYIYRFLILLTSIPILYSFKTSNNQDCIESLFSQIDKSLIKEYDKKESQNEYSIRNTIDSINYSIIRRWKNDKTPIIEFITNNLTKIDSWKEYHENRRLMAQGFMTTSNHTYIGKWNYYSDKGLLDSIVDYDKRYKVAFCDFFEIAKTKGFTGKNSSIKFKKDSRKWCVTKWTYHNDYSSAEGIELQVDSMSYNKVNLLGQY